MKSAKVTNEVMTAIARSSKPRNLSCLHLEVTDERLAPLARFNHLQTLQLIDTSRLTDASLIHLSQITSFRDLTISGANLRGSGITHLAKLAPLDTLAISNDALDDASLAAIGQLPRLERLYIGGGS